MNTLHPQTRLSRSWAITALTLVFLLFSVTVISAAQNDRAIKRKNSTEKRIALVIGNAAYATSPLTNPVNDARDMAAMLRKLDFEVIIATNADKRAMKKAITSFSRKLQKSGIGLFYYAGHGMQVNGANYLIPVSADVATESDIEYEAVRAGRVIGKMREADNKLNIVILDACRNNPFKRSFRSSSSGLARMDAPIGTIIAYATSPGSVAADGAGRNGLYTGALLKSFQQPGLTVQEAFNKAGMEVMADSNRKQVPWMSSTPVPGFYLAGSGTITVDRPEPDLRPDVQSKTGSLHVKTEPDRAEIFIDGYLEGTAPLTLKQVKPGGVTVRAALTGYDPVEKKVRIRVGRRSELTLILGREAGKQGRLFILPQPVDARIRILNIAPRYSEGMELDAGSYKIEVSKQGYVTDTRTVDLAAGEELEVKVALLEQVVTAPPAQEVVVIAPPVRPSSGASEIRREGRFIAYSNGTVQDSKTGLMWAAKNSPKNINWQGAKRYCQNFTGGGYTDWRMPTQDELSALYSAGIREVDSKGNHIIDIYLWVWASETRGSKAALVHFLHGLRYWLPQSDSIFLRALPVRGSN